MPQLPQPRPDINSVRVRPASNRPAWGGPVEEGASQSIICDYLGCPERFRVTTIDGLVPHDSLNVPIEFGHMFHLCEELHSAGEDWERPLARHAAELSLKYRNEQQQVQKWYNVTKVLYPIYVDYWKDEQDQVNKVPLLQEENFKVMYRLRSGRYVYLRGKMDGADLIPNEGIYLQENKTKGKVDVQSIERQLANDIQTMVYLIALKSLQEVRDDIPSDVPVRGVRYNVVRRPLAGGKGSIRPHKATKNKPAETMEEYYERLRGVINEDPSYYFRRWKSDVSTQEIELFEKQTLQPVLENLLDDYEWWSHCKIKNVDHFDYRERRQLFPQHRARHYRLPYGLYNLIKEGGFADIDDYINTGSKIGLQTCTNYFPELEENANN